MAAQCRTGSEYKRNTSFMQRSENVLSTTVQVVVQYHTNIIPTVKQ